MAKKGNNNNCAVLRVSEKTREKLIKFYEDKKRDIVIPYVVYEYEIKHFDLLTSHTAFNWIFFVV